MSSAINSSWTIWKKRQGSAESEHHAEQDRRNSSIDPLEGSQHRDPAGLPQSQLLAAISTPMDTNTMSSGSSSPSGTANYSWTSWLNPVGYFSRSSNNHQTHKNQVGSEDSSISPSVEAQQQQHSSWFYSSWFSPSVNSKTFEESIPNGILNSQELKLNIKESRKAIETDNNCCWAWFQTIDSTSGEFDDLDSSIGEASVINTKSEVVPVPFKKYPYTINFSRKDQIGEIEPSILLNYRPITTKTKIRIATQVYYNFKRERHLYLRSNYLDKSNNLSKSIKNILVVSITNNNHLIASSSSNSNSNNNKSSMNSKKISDLCINSIKKCLLNNSTDKLDEFNIQSISLEYNKSNDETIDNLFKLLMNWKECFKSVDYLQFIGYGSSFLITCEILKKVLDTDELISNSFVKVGLLSLNGSLPTQYNQDKPKSIITHTKSSGNLVGEANTTPVITHESIKVKNFHVLISELINRNVKMEFLGSISNYNTSLALELSHPNIFRSIYFNKTDYNNNFEVVLFKMLMISINLGAPIQKFLIQLKKYFCLGANEAVNNSFANDLNVIFFDSMVSFGLLTTNLYSKKSECLNFVKFSEEEYQLIDNEYNLIWSFHEFIEIFKEFKNLNSIELLSSLKKEYRNWNPTSKPLKELKFMLHVVTLINL